MDQKVNRMDPKRGKETERETEEKMERGRGTEGGHSMDAPSARSASVEAAVEATRQQWRELGWNDDDDDDTHRAY